MSAGYLGGLVAPVWQSMAGILAAASSLVAAAVLEGRVRRRAWGRISAAVLLAGALVGGYVVPELLGPEKGPTAAVLVYDALLVAVLGVCVSLARSPTRTELTDLAVDLGAAPVRDVDTLGRLVDAEPGLAADDDLQAALAVARRLEAANQVVRDRVQEAVGEVDRSRQRLVVAASNERRRLGFELTATVVTPLRDLVARAARAGVDVPGLFRAAERLEAAMLGLRPPGLAEGLTVALQQHPLVAALDAALEMTDERCDVVVEDTLYAVAVESLTNVVKHAGPCVVAVRLTVDEARACLTVTDGGIGGAAPAARSGLTGLADRLDALGGGLEVLSPPRGGTVVTAWAPRVLREAAPHRPIEASTPRAGGRSEMEWTA
jgi:hypothetical protein